MRHDQQEPAGSCHFIAERRPRRFAIVLTALYGAGVLWPLAADRYRLGTEKWTPKWAMHVPGTALTAAVAIVAPAVIWGWVRAWRMGLRLDSQGVTVRNDFRTYRFSWREVTGLVDGSAMMTGWATLMPGSLAAWTESGWCWALSVLAADGRAATATGTARQLLARPETMTAVRQAAEYHGKRPG